MEHSGTQSGTQEVSSEHHEALLCSADDRALARVAQKGLLIGDLQKVPGHGPGQSVPEVTSNLNHSVTLRLAVSLC